MSTPPKPDDSADGATNGTAGGDGVDARTTAVDAAGSADAAPSAEAGGSGSGPGAPSGSGSSGGTPPPWQRGGAAPGPSAGGAQGGAPGGGRPGGPATGATPAQAPQRPAGPPSGPMPTGRGDGAPGGGPQGGGPQGGGAQGGPQGGGSPGGRGPATAATAAGSASGRSSSDDSGQRSGEGSGTPASGQRSSTALIDAPTNQLSPEQLGMRGGSGRRPNGQDDEDDVADLTAARPSRNKNPRRASLQVKRFDPWSVLKLALVLGVALFFVWMFAVGVLYAVLDGMGVWAQLNGTYQDLTSDSGGGGQLITAGGVFGVAAIVGVINTILFTALASVSAFIYNISADVAGGIEVTLSERD